ncbi:MAG: TIGR01440 family protein [Syntrophomonadaceae bacterium]|nr:TIGR01440 family protein [Syntrophomonadaceae bacterium]MDD4548798.1 TIGR01440 family protein [Syntrophomonadaceae bacterium]
MEKHELAVLTETANSALKELLGVANLKPGQIVVVGCSTSEVQGKRIGKASSMEIAEAISDAILPLIKENNLFLAVQGCEHINRSLVVEEECAEKYGLEIVNVLPHLHAGGGFATINYERFKNPVLVEGIQAHAGMDIGDTFIGMNMKRVVVPVRSEIKSIGEAHLTMARTRAKLVGGERAHYQK